MRSSHKTRLINIGLTVLVIAFFLWAGIWIFLTAALAFVVGMGVMGWLFMTKNPYIMAVMAGLRLREAEADDEE